MKFSQQRQRGSTLMITLFICMVIGIVLASVMSMVSARYKTTARSMDWNEAMPVLEAGIEEAMTHLHDDSSPSANGWTSTNIAGQLVYTKQRSFTNGSYFYVTIYSATSNNPVIYSQGYVPSPVNRSQYISRMVKVGASNSPNVFTKAIAGPGTITLNGANAIVDSYDSRVGPYNTSTNRNANGNIATDSTASGAVSVGNGTVYGTAVTGPGGTVSVSGGVVGNTNWTSGIEPGWTNNNMNVAFISNSPPSGSFFTPTATSTGGSNITFLANGLYELSSFSTSGNGSSPMIVTGNATLLVTGSFSVAGQSYVEIEPGASLKLYVGGSVAIGGGGVVNGTGLASDFSLVGLSSCTSISYHGNASFIGTINAPEASLSLVGNGDTFGAVIVQSATISGNGNFHYDQALGAGGGLVATSWTEIL